VLTNTSETHYRAWKRLADELGIPFDRQRNELLRGVSRRRSLELMLNGQPATEEQVQEWMARKNSYYVEFIQQVTPAHILPGALELLEELRGSGIQIGVGSASKNTRTVLDRLHLWNYVDGVSDGYSVQRQKPAPDLFLHCARGAGRRSPRCLPQPGGHHTAGHPRRAGAGYHSLMAISETQAWQSVEAFAPDLAAE